MKIVQHPSVRLRLAGDAKVVRSCVVGRSASLGAGDRRALYLAAAMAAASGGASCRLSSTVCAQLK